MLVREFMSTELTTLQETASLLDATLIFARSSLRHLPILNGSQLVGIVTERDLKHYTPSILSGIPAEQYNQLMESTPLSKIMTRSPVTVRPENSVAEAAQILHDRRIGCVLVVDNGELKGIITTTDMLKLLVEILGQGNAAPSKLAS
jgi:acetoin utilization protein AcuB